MSASPALATLRHSANAPVDRAGARTVHAAGTSWLKPLVGASWLKPLLLGVAALSPRQPRALAEASCVTLADVPDRYDSKAALIVVDVQNDFADPGGSLYVKGAGEICRW